MAGRDDTGFYVTSDQRQSKLWLVDIGEFTKLMRRVSADYPSEIHRVRNSETGDTLEWRGNGPLPAHVRAKMEQVSQSPVQVASA